MPSSSKFHPAQPLAVAVHVVLRVPELQRGALAATVGHRGGRLGAHLVRLLLLDGADADDAVVRDEGLDLAMEA